MTHIYDNDFLHIEVEKSEIPWLKIFTNKPFKELSECDMQTKEALFLMIDICEKTLIEYYSPDKINIASFGNYLPRLHVHIMARFKEDSFFPESMWGIKQREANLNLPLFEGFLELLLKNINKG